MVQLGDAPGLRRGDLDHRLLGLDRDQRLVGDDAIADADVPGDDLRLLQTFAEVGQPEGAHAYSNRLLTAPTTRSALGK